MKKAAFTILLCLAISSPALAGGRDRYDRQDGRYNTHGRNDYPAEHRRHDRADRVPGILAAVMGGVILGAIVAQNSRTPEHGQESRYSSRCYDRKVTEQTLSGRYVTYVEQVCE
jgi:hypothetical protein